MDSSAIAKYFLDGAANVLKSLALRCALRPAAGQPGTRNAHAFLGVLQDNAVFHPCYPTTNLKPERTEAIVLHTFPARERDKLVVFLTPDHGKRKGWAYGARR